MEFVALSEEDGLSDYEDGILGMWSGNVSGYDNTEMLMPGLVTDSTITEEIFSFYMTGLSETSYIDFGTIDSSVVTDSSDITWISIESENYWWTNKVTGFRWGDDWSDDTEYAIPELEGFTDTGTSCISGPSASINSFMGTILNTSGSTEMDDSWDYIFNCSDKDDMPSFELLFGDFWMKVTPEDYIVDL